LKNGHCVYLKAMNLKVLRMLLKVQKRRNVDWLLILTWTLSRRLKQAPRLWNEAVYRTLQRLKFTRCKSDPCLYVRVDQDVKGTVSFAIIANLRIRSHSNLKFRRATGIDQQELMTNYKMTDLGDLSWCLGIQVTQGKDDVLLSQSTYVTKLLERFGMQD